MENIIENSPEKRIEMIIAENEKQADEQIVEIRRINSEFQRLSQDAVVALEKMKQAGEEYRRAIRN